MTAGAELGKRAGSGERTETEVVGDNRDEVINTIVDKLLETARPTLESFDDDFVNKGLAPVEAWIGGLKQCFSQTAQELKTQNERIDHEISKK